MNERVLCVGERKGIGVSCPRIRERRGQREGSD
jgi:hypothetical protein